MKNKKLIAGLLIASMAVSVCACNGDDKKPSKDDDTEIEETKKPDKDDDDEDETKKPDETKAPEETTEPAATEETTEAPAEAKGTKLETTLFDFSYDPNVWVYDAEKVTDKEDRCSLTLKIPDPEKEDKFLVNLTITANVGDPYSFREDLWNRKFDQKTYDEGGYDSEMVDLGGAKFIKTDGKNWGADATYYFNRFEGAKESIEVKITGDTERKDIQDVLDTLNFKMNDVGNEDGPWYWEGEPFSAGEKEATVGTTKIKATFNKLSESVVTHETFEHDIAVVGDKCYLLEHNIISEYTIGEDGLTFVKDYDLGKDYESIMATNDGKLFIAGFQRPLTEWKDGEAVQQYEDREIKKVAMSPTGTWGISWFVSNEMQRVDLKGDGTYSLTPWQPAEAKTVSHMNVTDKYIFVCASSSDEEQSGHFVFVYDTEGNFVKQLSGADGKSLGSITYACETANGFMGMDGNMRRVVLWNADGEYIGDTSSKDIFDAGYPWFSNTTKIGDDQFMTVMTQERTDKSAKETIVYKLELGA